jgi:hypothetical protein
VRDKEGGRARRWFAVERNEERRGMGIRKKCGSEEKE